MHSRFCACVLHRQTWLSAIPHAMRSIYCSTSIGSTEQCTRSPPSPTTPLWRSVTTGAVVTPDVAKEGRREWGRDECIWEPPPMVCSMSLWNSVWSFSSDLPVIPDRCQTAGNAGTSPSPSMPGYASEPAQTYGGRDDSSAPESPYESSSPGWSGTRPQWEQSLQLDTKIIKNYERACLKRPPLLAIKIGSLKAGGFSDRFNCTEIRDILTGLCGPSRQVVSHGSGLSRQVSLYMYIQEKIWPR